MRLKYLAGDFVPFSLRGGQFALSIPAKKGMTPFKAEREITHILREYAEPGIYTRITRPSRAKFTEKLATLVGDALEAAEINGHDPKKILQDAVSGVRGHYYRALYDQLQKGEQLKGNESSARAVVRLNAGLSNVLESLERRGLKMDTETRKMIRSAMEAAAEAEGVRLRRKSRRPGK